MERAILAPILFKIPTYFLILSLVCTLGVFVLPKWAEKFGQSESLALRLYFLILISGIFGGRLFHVVFEAPALYRENPLAALFVWEGGLVFLGAVLVSLAASWFWLKKQGEDFFLWADLFAPWMAFGYGLGRLGCFFNGCCYGKECHLPWAVKFPSHMFVISPFVPRHPTQLYSCAASLLAFGILAVWALKKRDQLKAFRNTGFIFCSWLLIHGVSRFTVEQFRDDDRGPLYLGWSLSSFVSLFLIGLGFWGFFFLRSRQQKN